MVTGICIFIIINSFDLYFFLEPVWQTLTQSEVTDKIMNDFEFDNLIMAMTHQRDCPHRDSGGDDPTAKNGETGAEGVPEDTADTHAVDILPGSCTHS